MIQYILTHGPNLVWIAWNHIKGQGQGIHHFNGSHRVAVRSLELKECRSQEVPIQPRVTLIFFPSKHQVSANIGANTNLLRPKKDANIDPNWCNTVLSFWIFLSFQKNPCGPWAKIRIWLGLLFHRPWSSVDLWHSYAAMLITVTAISKLHNFPNTLPNSQPLPFPAQMNASRQLQIWDDELLVLPIGTVLTDEPWKTWCLTREELLHPRRIIGSGPHVMDVSW